MKPLLLLINQIQRTINFDLANWRHRIVNHHYRRLIRRRSSASFYYFKIFFYSCTSKFVGEYCQHLNPCHTGPGPRCQNGGSCQVKVSAGGSPSFTCLCPLGYSASLCEIPIANSCDKRPCLNGGTCSLRSLEAYQCTCAPGYTGECEEHLFSL